MKRQVKVDDIPRVIVREMCENLKNSSCQLSAGKAHSKIKSILRNCILRKTWTSWENDEKG